MYTVKKHFLEYQEVITECKALSEALCYCFECDLTREDGHAVSVHNNVGSIFEVNYYGNVEINIDKCATKEELAQIKNHVIREGLRWDYSLDKELLSSEATFYIPEADIFLSFKFKKEYSLDGVFETLDNFYHQWQHPEFEDSELANEIENATPDNWIEDHMYNSSTYQISSISRFETRTSKEDKHDQKKLSLSEQIQFATTRITTPQSPSYVKAKEPEI